MGWSPAEEDGGVGDGGSVSSLALLRSRCTGGARGTGLRRTDYDIVRVQDLEHCERRARVSLKSARRSGQFRRAQSVAYCQIQSPLASS